MAQPADVDSLPASCDDGYRQSHALLSAGRPPVPVVCGFWPESDKGAMNAGIDAETVESSPGVSWDDNRTRVAVV